MSEHVKETSDSGFENDVLQSAQPVLVDFWAAWCAPCRMLAPTVEAVAEKYAASARVMKLNVDDNPSVSQRFGIKGIPTLILFKNGKEEERVVGATSEAAISRMLDKHIGAATARLAQAIRFSPPWWRGYVFVSAAAPVLCPVLNFRISDLRSQI